MLEDLASYPQNLHLPITPPLQSVPNLSLGLESLATYHFELLLSL